MCPPPSRPGSSQNEQVRFTVTASDSEVGDHDFQLKAVGTDANAISHQKLATLRVIDFSLEPGSNFNAPHGASGSTPFTVTPSSNFYFRPIRAACSIAGNPSGIFCSVTPSAFTLPNSPMTVVLAVQST